MLDPCQVLVKFCNFCKFLSPYLRRPRGRITGAPPFFWASVVARLQDLQVLQNSEGEALANVLDAIPIGIRGCSRRTTTEEGKSEDGTLPDLIKIW